MLREWREQRRRSRELLHQCEDDIVTRADNAEKGIRLVTFRNKVTGEDTTGPPTETELWIDAHALARAPALRARVYRRRRLK